MSGLAFIAGNYTDSENEDQNSNDSNDKITVDSMAVFSASDSSANADAKPNSENPALNLETSKQSKTFVVQKPGTKQKKISQFFSTTVVKGSTSKNENIAKNCPKKLFSCRHCGFGAKSLQGLTIHEFNCRQNPNRRNQHQKIEKIEKIEKKTQATNFFRISAEVKESEIFLEKDSESEKNSESEKESESIETSQNTEPPTKISRNSYNCQIKARVIEKYLEAKLEDDSLSLSSFLNHQDEKITKSMLYKWLKDKDSILKHAYEGCVLKRIHKNPKENPRHAKTAKILNERFLDMRTKGCKVGFNWILMTGKKIAKTHSFPVFTRRAAQEFIVKYDVKLRVVQFKKQKPKSANEDILKHWLCDLRLVLHD